MPCRREGPPTCGARLQRESFESGQEQGWPRAGRGLRLLTRLSCVVLFSSVACEARVPPTTACLRPQDEIWLVSAREMPSRLPLCCMCQPLLCYQQYEKCCDCGCGRWQCRSECTFWETDDPGRLTVVYVHGNRMTEEWIRRRGLDLYNGLVGCCPHAPPIRLVLWSWPSESIPNRLAVKRDARVKFRRIPTQAYYLASWLNHYSCDRQLSLLGYSYGAATLLSSLHILGGGQLECRCLSRCEPPPRIHMAVWAPAVQSNWLTPCGRLCRALPCVESGIVFYNRCDPVLRRFRRVIFSATGPALGHVGLTNPHCCYPGYGAICQFDATRYVGKKHEWDRYRDCPCIMGRIRWTALWFAH